MHVCDVSPFCDEKSFMERDAHALLRVSLN